VGPEHEARDGVYLRFVDRETAQERARRSSQRSSRKAARRSVGSA